jgi:DNA-binding CsgD family transcriptional regulator
MAADELLATIDAIYAAGMDGELWPQALGAAIRLIGGTGATLEIFDRSTLANLNFFNFGTPPVGDLDYLEHYMPLNPRMPDALRRKAGDVTWDYRLLDEGGIDGSPFYNEFLAPLDLRYNVIGILRNDETVFSGFTVQRSQRQGHVERAEIALMAQLVPHVARSVDMMRRLKTEQAASRSFERGLDWLLEGVALVRADGSIAYANDSLQAMARAGDGVLIKKNRIEFASASARARFDEALAGIHALRSGATEASCADFAAARPSGTAAHVVSVRPLRPTRHEGAMRLPIAIVFIHNPLQRADEDIELLREVFGLTNAEAELALALRKGVPLGEYGATRQVSPNTIYTHLRRLKEKTGCRRLPELIGKLNDVRTLLRRS